VLQRQAIKLHDTVNVTYLQMSAIALRMKLARINHFREKMKSFGSSFSEKRKK